MIGFWFLISFAVSFLVSAAFALASLRRERRRRVAFLKLARPIIVPVRQGFVDPYRVGAGSIYDMGDEP